MDVWFDVMSYSSVFKHVACAINGSGPIAGGCMVRIHLRRYWLTDPTQTTKRCMGAFKKSISLQTSRGVAPYAWDLAAVAIFPERRRTALLEGRDEIVGKFTDECPDKERKIPATHL